MGNNNCPGPGQPFAVRTALVMFMALVVAGVAGGLFYTEVQSAGLAVLTGGATFASAWRFFDWLIR
ncbi:hypothetical protein [Amycolatopsis sp. 195334CR]|uniref:hypothetical protein n=1 Tax=Amycolatopsis sp. 195334CR TaxID=2814588 RepID=UPI001A90A2E7|nr:hypothetical protein [Amycolatopsis sp. 195334CR]MBN6034203.1 hypothetical protein [Amycolatopsis sp. 195334CR]